MSNNYTVKPVYKAIQVLLCLAEADQPLRLSEICRRVGLPKTTVFRYLYTLQVCGLVAHDPERDLYQPGLRLWELGQATREQIDTRAAAVSHMEALRDRFNETVNLGILAGHEVVYLEIVESRHSLRMLAALGGRDPLYSTALGKALLAFLPEEHWAAHLPPTLIPRTLRTLTTMEALKRDLIETRARGFSVDRGENEEGACCIGAPIFDQRGRVVAAVSLSAPDSRIGPALEQEMADAIKQTATEISLRLGYHPNHANLR